MKLLLLSLIACFLPSPVHHPPCMQRRGSKKIILNPIKKRGEAFLAPPRLLTIYRVVSKNKGALKRIHIGFASKAPADLFRWIRLLAADDESLPPPVALSWIFIHRTCPR